MTKREIICGIYKIQNKTNGKCYIGQSIDVYKRLNNHKNSNYRKYNINKALYYAITKYGIENFDFTLIEACDVDKLDEREIYWISYYNSFQCGYNCTIGGKGVNNTKISEIEYGVRKIHGVYVDIHSKSETEDLVCEIIDTYCFNYENSRYDYFSEECEDMSLGKLEEYIEGVDTMLNDFCDGYDNFESWAECNL